MISATAQDQAATAAAGERKPIAWVDFAKALLIYLVIVGHARGIDKDLTDFIYAFHLPAFLFVSGLLLARPLAQASPLDFWRRYIGPYISLYAFFSVISIAIWLAITPGARNLPSLLSAGWGALYGVQGEGRGLVHDNAPLWYLPFLITSLVAVWALNKGGRIVAAIGAAAYFLFALYYDGPRLPWSLDVGGVGALFVFLGQMAAPYLREPLPTLTPLARRGVSLAVFLVCLAAVHVIADLNGRANINLSEFGRHGVLFLAGALAGTAGVVALGMQFPANRLIAKISASTLIIFCTHIYLARLVRDVPVDGNTVPGTVVVLLLDLAILLVCLALSLVTDGWIRKHIMRR